MSSVRDGLFTVLLVDDEPLARSTLRLLLQRDSQCRVLAECADGQEAVRAIRESKPDLVFLDVQMPEMSGFDVIEQVGAGLMPAVVMVTAYDRYALRAFDVNALDYLLKPFDDERFERALARAKEAVVRRRADRLDRRLASVLDDYRRLSAGRSAPPLRRLAVRSGGRIDFLEIQEIDWIEAADQYVELHVGERTSLLRRPLSHLERELPERSFARIHRSTIVNLERVRRLIPHTKGDSWLILQDGTRLKLSRSRREEVKSMLTGDGFEGPCDD